jgi:ABC-type uncharacterized transport system permease subunit
MRTSRSAALTFSSVSRDLPVMPRKVCVSFSERLSNIRYPIDTREIIPFTAPARYAKLDDHFRSTATNPDDVPDGSQLMASTLSGLAAFASVAAAFLYALGAALQIHSLWHKRNVAIRTLALITVPALVFHAAATYLQINTDEGLYLGFFAAASLITLLMVGFVLLSSARLPVQNLLLPVLVIGALAVLASLFGETGFVARQSLPPALAIHILFSVVAYSILFMAACQSVLLAYLEHALKAKSSIRALRLLPPLETMEALLFSLLWSGILTLTAAIVTGFVFLDDMFAQHVVHHTVFAMASWVLYAVLLTGRSFFGWRSRTATYWTLIAFSLLVLGYFGSKFVMEILLSPDTP